MRRRRARADGTPGVCEDGDPHADESGDDRGDGADGEGDGGHDAVGPHPGARLVLGRPRDEDGDAARDDDHEDCAEAVLGVEEGGGSQGDGVIELDELGVLLVRIGGARGARGRRDVKQDRGHLAQQEDGKEDACGQERRGPGSTSVAGVRQASRVPHQGVHMEWGSDGASCGETSSTTRRRASPPRLQQLVAHAQRCPPQSAQRACERAPMMLVPTMSMGAGSSEDSATMPPLMHCFAEARMKSSAMPRGEDTENRPRFCFLTVGPILTNDECTILGALIVTVPRRHACRPWAQPSGEKSVRAQLRARRH